jgi:hypothetical protein
MNWVWDVEIKPMVGQFAHAETTDGVFREGKITGVRTYEVPINGTKFIVPLAFELNGDPNDVIEFKQLAKLSLS